MKKIILTFGVACLLGSCTLPWVKQEVQEEVIPEEAMEGTEVPAKSGETTTVATTPPGGNPTTPPPVQGPGIVPNDTPKAIAEGGVYLPYTSTAVAQAKGHVVLFFHAGWCPTCIAANKDISARLADIPKDVTILKVNYDDATDLRELYGVTAQHTFVQVDNNGTLLKKWRGGNTLSELLGQIQK